MSRPAYRALSIRGGAAGRVVDIRGPLQLTLSCRQKVCLRSAAITKPERPVEPVFRDRDSGRSQTPLPAEVRADRCSSPPPPPPLVVLLRSQRASKSHYLCLRKSVASGLFDSVKDGFNLEEGAAGRELAEQKSASSSLVFGVASFLAYQLRQVGPAGKVLVGALVSTALLCSAASSSERKPSYAIIGRAGIGGGWALAFFVAYATLINTCRRPASSARKLRRCCSC